MNVTQVFNGFQMASENTQRLLLGSTVFLVIISHNRYSQK